MTTERRNQETVARCVSSLVLYVNTGTGRHVKDAMAADVQAVARIVAGWKLSEEDVGASILRPVEAELVARYGPVKGRRLSDEFAEVFNGTAGPVDPVGLVVSPPVAAR